MYKLSAAVRILPLCIVGGIPNVNAAGKMVLKDWNRFVISFVLYKGTQALGFIYLQSLFRKLAGLEEQSWKSEPAQAPVVQ